MGLHYSNFFPVSLLKKVYEISTFTLYPAKKTKTFTWDWLCKSISSGAQSVTLLQKCLSHPSLLTTIFWNPATHITETGHQIGEKLLIANQLDQSLWWTNQKDWATTVRSYLLHSFLKVHIFAAPFTSNHEQCKYAEPKPFCWAKPACFDFSSSNCAV